MRSTCHRPVHDVVSTSILAACIVRTGALCLVAVWLAGAVNAAETRQAASGRQWALLIGVDKYHRVPQLDCSAEDVRQLATTLRLRGGYSADSVMEITDQAVNPRQQPLRTSLQSEIPAFLGQVKPEDSILVYFSGHGFRDKQGKLYLAPLDCNPDDLAASAIAIEWLRQKLGECKARFKLLVLDACHAGSEKGPADRDTVAADALGEPFRELESVVTIASSTANEKSQIWKEKKQSLFSYWLKQALKGHADENGDGAVDIDELYKYVSRNVTSTAKTRFPAPQTPVRIIRPGVTGVPTVIDLKPQSLRQTLGDVAEEVAAAIHQRGLKKVGVLEFIEDTKLGEMLGADYGLLGRYCADELERRLGDQSDEKFSVVDRRQLQRTLSAQRFSLADLGSADAIQSIAGKLGGLSVIAVGTLSNRTGRIMSLKCKLMCTDTMELAGWAGGMAALNENEWAMLGKSVQVTPEDRRPDYTAPVLIERLDERANEPHPLTDASFPFRVKLAIGGKERKGVFRGNDYFVPVKKGEVYEIWIENRHVTKVLVRLLVDGLNTLPEKETTKGAQMFVIGKRVSLDEARPWILSPRPKSVSGPFRVRGFVTETGARGKYREFTVVDAAESLAARRQFTDQIGLITAAFYAPDVGERGVGTGLGQERDADLTEREGRCGKLLAVVHLRYVEADALEKAQ